MSKKLRLLFALPLALIGCVDAPPVETDVAAQWVPIDPPDHEDQGQGGGPEVCKTVNLSGRVMYNDLRDSGRFGDRSTLFVTQAGTKDPFDGGSGDRENYLGMKGAQIMVYEIDLQTPANQGCTRTAYVSSTHADEDGVWSWTGQVCDRCRVDGEGANDNNVSVGVKIGLSYCDDAGGGCFSVDDPVSNGTDHHDGTWSGATWTRWWRGVDATTPRRVTNSTPISLGVDYFQANLPAVRMEVTDTYAKAANIFASMIDVTERVHVVEGVPFDRARWGTIRAYYPSLTGGVAHSHQADKICISDRNSWIDGSEVTHEYGHLIHFWQWEGFGKWQSFCKDSDGDGELDVVNNDGVEDDTDFNGDDVPDDGDFRHECSEGRDENTGELQREHAGAAFKEGWANFISRVTFEGANTGHSCGTIQSQTPTAPSFRLFNNALACPAGAATCIEGRHFIEDVEQALCEVYDGDGDDTLNLTFADMIDTLQFVWSLADPADRQEVIDADTFGIHDTAVVPLGICRFAETLDGAMGLSRADVESAMAGAKIECNL